MPTRRHKIHPDSTHDEPYARAAAEYIGARHTGGSNAPGLPSGKRAGQILALLPGDPGLAATMASMTDKPVHQVRLQGGDSSSDSYCYRS